MVQIFNHAITMHSVQGCDRQGPGFFNVPMFYRDMGLISSVVVYNISEITWKTSVNPQIGELL